MCIRDRLKARHDEEFLCKQLVMEGVLAIQEGENPKFIEEKLYKLLPASSKKKEQKEDDGAVEPEKKRRFGRKKNA